MPLAPPKPCTQPRCRAYATKGSRCDDHQRKAWDHKGKTAADRGYGSQWQRIRSRALKRDNHLCQSCIKLGIYTQANQVDHIVNKARGGTDDLTNLQSLCNRCHKDKTQTEAQLGRYE